MTSAIVGARQLASAQYGSFRVVGIEKTHDRYIHAEKPLGHGALIGDAPGSYSRSSAVAATSPVDRPCTAGSGRANPASTHPLPGSYLDVPVRVGGAPFGFLSLAGSANGRFSSQDQELVAAIAVATGAALTNSSLAGQLVLRDRWSAAATLIRAQLASTTGEDPLTTIVRCLAALSDADIVAVALTRGDQLEVEVAAGPGADQIRHRRFALAHSVSRRAMEGGKPILLPLWCGVDAISDRTVEVPPGSLMIIPLFTQDRPRGVLSLFRREQQSPFVGTDLLLAADIAQQASVALELSDARRTEATAAVVEDRELISNRLHDEVMQELFGIGLSLEATAGDMEPGESSNRIYQRVDEIDLVINRIRSQIFP